MSHLPPGEAARNSFPFHPRRRRKGDTAAERPLFVLVLRPEPDVADPIRALKAALKRLWRSYGLRCVDVREERAS
jgi:hypothetical protein